MPQNPSFLEEQPNQVGIKLENLHPITNRKTGSFFWNILEARSIYI